MLGPVMIFAAASPVEHVLPHALHDEPLFRIQLAGEHTTVPMLGIRDGYYSFYFTNHMMMTMVAGIVAILVFWWLARKLRPSAEGGSSAPPRGRIAQLFETMCVFVRDEVAKPNLGHLTDRYIPYIWTIFFFILFANLMGLLPFGYALQLMTGDVHYSHWGGTATSNLALNIVLAVASFIAVVVIGIRESGAKHFFNHFNPVGWHHTGADKFIMLPIGVMLFVLEWMGLIIKCTVLAMRLFGTMMAGHLVIAAFVMLIFSAATVGQYLGYGVGVAVVVGGTLLTLLELFICVLQAFIFTFLTVLFIATGAVHGHEHDETHDATRDEPHLDTGKLTNPARLAAPPA